MARFSSKLPATDKAPHRVLLARQLRELRHGKRLTQQRLAELSGLSTGTISTAEGGLLAPSKRTVTDYVLACGELDPSPWLARREAAAREYAADRAERKTQQRALARDDRHRQVWRSTWERWERTRKLTPPSHASGSSSLAFWLESLRNYRSLSYRSLARKSDYSHSTLTAMGRGHQPVTVRGLTAFLQACGVLTFSEQIEWLNLLERTSSSPRRAMDAALEQERLRSLMGPKSGDGSANSSARLDAEDTLDWQRGRPAWRMKYAITVDHQVMRNNLQALGRYYGSTFIPVLAHHTGLPAKSIKTYLDGGGLTVDGKNRLAAALMRIGKTPPNRDALHIILPPQAVGRSAPGARAQPGGYRRKKGNTPHSSDYVPYWR